MTERHIKCKKIYNLPLKWCIQVLQGKNINTSPMTLKFRFFKKNLTIFLQIWTLRSPSQICTYSFFRKSPNVMISYSDHILNVLSTFLNLLWCYKHFSALPELKNVNRWPQNDVFWWFQALYMCFQPTLHLKWVTLGDFASLVYLWIFRISSSFCATRPWSFINIFQTFKNMH